MECEVIIVREVSKRTSGKANIEERKISDSSLAQALRNRVYNSLKPISFGLAILFEILAISHIYFLPAPQSRIMALVASGTCAVLILFRIGLAYFNLPQRFAHMYSFLISAVVLTNSLLHLYLLPEAQHTTNLILLLVGMGFLILSTEWFILGVVLSWLGWLYAVWQAGISSLWLHYGFALLSSTVLSSIVHIAHYKSVVKLETFKLDLEGKVKDRTRELKTQLEELQVLHDISVQVTHTLDEDQVIQLAINRLSDTLFPERLSVMVLDKEKNRLVLHDSCRDKVFSPDVYTIPVGEGVTGHVALTAEPLLIPDVRDCSYYIEDDPEIRSELCVPIKVGRDVLGVINVDSHQVQGFSEADQRLLSTLASQLANAIDRIRWFGETRQALNRLNSLHRIDQEINNSTELIPILNVFLKEISIHLKMDAVSVLLYNEQNQTLDYIAGRGFKSVDHPTLRSGVGSGYLGKAYQEQDILSVPDVDRASFSNSHRMIFDQEGFRSYIAAPLVAKGKIKGIVECYFRNRLDPSQEWIETLRTFADQAAIAIDNVLVFSDLQQANIDLHMTYNRTLEGWAKALELRDAETEGHSRRVSDLAGVLGRSLGLGDRDLIHLYWGSLLHDLGKLGIPDRVLHKQDPLTQEERDLIEQHPVYGRELLQEIQYLQPAMDVLYYHHEKWDGSGYPRGLAGEEIPLKARIFAVVDVYDALCSDRPYRDAWSEEEARAYIKRQAGSHFDPHIAEVFLDIVNGQVPPGTEKVRVRVSRQG